MKYLLFLILAGCSSMNEGPKPLRLTYSGSAAGRKAAYLAVEEWRLTCGVDVALADGATPLVETDEEIPEGKGGASLTSATFEPKWIHIRPRYPYRSIYVHEIGHVLGLNHTASGVMAGGQIPYNARVTEADCLALANVNYTGE